MNTDCTRGHRGRRSGFTLPEATVALVILGIAAAGVLVPFGGGAAVQAEGLHRTLGAKLANDLLEQIINTPFDRIIKDAGETWPGWDGYTEPQGQVRDAGLAVFTDPIYAGFSRQVACDYLYVYEEIGPPLAPNFIRASVRVRYQGREIITLDRLITR